MKLPKLTFPKRMKLTNPWKLLKSARTEVARLKSDNDFLEREVIRLTRAKHFVDNNIPSEDAARALLMQLRVHGMQDSHARTGYGVTAFIPEEVLSALTKSDSETRIAFVRVVADELVRRALAGAWNVNSRGAVSALMFEPLVPGKPLGAAGAIFDTPLGTQIALGRKRGETAVDYATRQDQVALTLGRRQHPLLPREAESDL